jgi:nitrous oxidase accessory protein NosD
MSKLLLCCVLLLAGLGVSAPASATECSEITSAGLTIVTPGHYCLGADIASGLSGVTINASHVDLDCRGYSLRSTNTNNAQNTYGVYVANQSDVHVHHCHISGGYAAGIYAYQDNALANQNHNLSFHDNTISNTFWFGILAYGTSIDIRDNLIYDIGGRASFSMGIRVGGSTLADQKRAFMVRDNVLRDVVSTVNNSYGIYANNANASSFVGNTITGTTGESSSFVETGIKVAAGASNKITGNQITGGGGDNDIGIQAPAADACYDNHIRTFLYTSTCDNSLGNF